MNTLPRSVRTFEEFVDVVEEYDRLVDHDLRRGQLYFNSFFFYFPDHARTLVDTDRDPFHVDDNLPNFLEAVAKVFEEES